VCDDLAAELGPAACLAGRTTLPVWAAALQAADVVVANDSGGMHLAAAVGVPVVAVFGMTDPEQTGPLGRRIRIVQDGASGAATSPAIRRKPRKGWPRFRPSGYIRPFRTWR
jgi:ADP-heptose:LPS heptosyltransferase